MLQLMLVDDEVHVVERFATTIHWIDEGFEQVHKAYSGVEALSLLEQHSIDIVITDIRMPGMTGLQLIAEVKRRWPKTKCILLSGHSDFAYAQEAIQQQTEDYLMKPVTEQKLLETIRRVKEKLEQEWADFLSRQRLVYTLKEHLPFLRGKLLHDLLQGRTLSEKTLKEKLRMLELPEMLGNPCGIMMIRMEESFADLDEERLSLMEYAIGNMAEELFGERYASWYTKDVHDYLVFVLTGRDGPADEEDFSWMDRTAAQLQTAVQQYLKGKISVLISGRGVFPRDLPVLYNSSVAAFRSRVGKEHGLLMRVGDDLLDSEIRSLHHLYEPPTLIHLLEAGRWDDAAAKLGLIFNELEAKWSESQEYLLEVFFTVSAAFTYIAHKNSRQLWQLIGGDYDKLLENHPVRSFSQLKDWSYRILQRLQEDMDREAKDSRTAIIREIRRYVEEHLSQDVSLQAIADHIYLHPVYVSKIYKSETGDNLSDYVNQVRMEKAAYLLKNSHDKVYEIAARLGYKRPHSFNHAFKRHFGITPQEYRDRHS